VSQIQTGRYADLLRRYLGMKGVTEVAGELSPEISPVFILESDLPEWNFLKGTKLMSGVWTRGPVAAQNSAVRLRNPAGTGVVAIINEIQGESNNASVIIVARDTDQGNLATILPSVSRDTRTPATDSSALIQSTGNNVATLGESFLTFQILATTTFRGTPSLVLTPGFQMQLTCLTVNSDIRGFFQWRERRLDVLEGA